MMIISGCSTHISDTEPETTAASETAETVSAPETAETTETADDTQYTIPDEELSGMNTSEDPLPDDGNGEAIFERLKADSYFGNENAEASALLDRGSFAKDIVKYSGFAQRQHYYICQNDYTDMTAYSQEMKFAEIAVNQGFMLRPASPEFKPGRPVTDGEVLRGLLYA